MRFFLLLPALVFLASCQIPTDLSTAAVTGDPTQVPTPGETVSVTENDTTGTEKPEPAKPVLPGFATSGWEEQKKEIASSGGLSGIKNTYTSIQTDQKVIAITFDDGPQPQNTPRLLKILKDRNIKATFYVVGDMVKNFPKVLAQTAADGHEIGNHTVTHGTLSRMSTSGLQKELANAHQMIVEVTGVAPRTMRPPGGAIKSSQKDYMMQEFGYPTILWSVDPEDWKRPGSSVVTQRLIKGASPGGILLVHDLHAPTIDAMPETLDKLLAEGYRFVTISELIEMDQSGKK